MPVFISSWPVPRYVPQGRTKKYELNESDLKMACDTLDKWLDCVAQVSVQVGGRVRLCGKGGGCMFCADD